MISSDVFLIRHIIVKKLTDIQLYYVQQRVNQLSILNGPGYKAKSGEEESVLKNVRDFFLDEEAKLKKVPEPNMDDISRMEKVSFFFDKIGQ